MRLLGILTATVLLATGLAGCSSSGSADRDASSRGTCSDPSGSVATSPAVTCGPPVDAGRKEFCDTQTSLFRDLMGDVSDPQVPTDEEMADAVKAWADHLEEVGTPAGIPDAARAGFEDLLAQAEDIDVQDFSIDDLDELAAGGRDASKQAQEKADAFATYLSKTCGNPLDDLDMPELPSPTP